MGGTAVPAPIPARKTRKPALLTEAGTKDLRF
jgi:hypothetical protein